jgi:hypothetical protein
MGPEKNKALFDLTAASRITGMSGEFQRREDLGVTLELLSTFFNKVGAEHTVTEATMITRLHALSQIQDSQLGISGFEPLFAMRHDRPNGSVKAKKTPAHDSFLQDGIEYKTRVISLNMPYHRSENIEFYGINMYVPTIREQTEALSPTGINRSRLVVVNERGEFVEEAEAITGETSVFAVINNETGDAKAYSVEIEEEDTNSNSYLGDSGVRYISTEEAIVSLGDGRQVRVRELKEDLLREVIDELREGTTKLGQIVGQLEGLSDDEKKAVHASVNGYHLVED